MDLVAIKNLIPVGLFLLFFSKNNLNKIMSNVKKPTPSCGVDN